MKHIILIVDSTQMLLAQERIRAIAAHIGVSISEFVRAVENLNNSMPKFEDVRESLKELTIRLDNMYLDYPYDLDLTGPQWEKPVNAHTGFPQVVLTLRFARVRGPPYLNYRLLPSTKMKM